MGTEVNIFFILDTISNHLWTSNSVCLPLAILPHPPSPFAPRSYPFLFSSSILLSFSFPPPSYPFLFPSPILPLPLFLPHPIRSPFPPHPTPFLILPLPFILPHITPFVSPYPTLTLPLFLPYPTPFFISFLILPPSSFPPTSAWKIMTAFTDPHSCSVYNTRLEISFVIML